MDTSGETADLMVKESIQLTESTIKLLAAGSKNLAAFLYALAKDNKKLVGKTNIKRLVQEGKPLQNFQIKESDFEDFQEFAKPNLLYAAVVDKNAKDGMIALITNTDYLSQVNLFMERRGYPAPTAEQTERAKNAVPRAQQGNSSPERGNGLTASRTSRTMRTTENTGEKISDIPTVKGRLAVLQKTAEGMRQGQQPQRAKISPQKTK